MGHQLDGKAALVTGGSQGIGKATAAALADAGADVVICGRRKDVLEEALAEIVANGGPGRVHAVQADVSDRDDVERLHQEAVEAFGAVDILVNNAGISRRGGLMELSDEDWKADLELKLFGAIRLCRQVVPGMIEGGGGRIINIVAISGKHPGAASAPTSVSRAAGIAFTKALSKELAPHDILVNAICIGYIKSGQHDRRWQNTAPDTPREDYYSEVARSRSIPLGRAGEASEVASLITFLATDGTFISGTAINVDGGQSSAT